MRIKRLSYILLQNFHHFDFEYKLFAEIFILLLSFQAKWFIKSMHSHYNSWIQPWSCHMYKEWQENKCKWTNLCHFNPVVLLWSFKKCWNYEIKWAWIYRISKYYSYRPILCPKLYNIVDYNRYTDNVAHSTMIISGQ